MKEKQPAHTGYRKGRKAAFRVLYPCYHRNDTDVTV